MASFTIVASRFWDLYVTQAILTGLWFTRINTYNFSLLYAWIIFLCDLIYIIDALARASKTNSSRSLWTSSRSLSLIIRSHGWWTIAISGLCFIRFVTFVPYHVLVILQLDINGFYLILCVFRLARLLKSGRIYAHIIWTVSKLRENGRCFIVAGNMNTRSSRKGILQKNSSTKTGKNPHFLKHFYKLKDNEIEQERSTFRTQIGKTRLQRTEYSSLKNRLVLWNSPVPASCLI